LNSATGEALWRGGGRNAFDESARPTPLSGKSRFALVPTDFDAARGHSAAGHYFYPNILTVATGMEEHKITPSIIEATRASGHPAALQSDGGVSNISFSFRA